MKSKRMALKAARALSETPTYHPLKRGRYRHNKSRPVVILKKAQVGSHRRSVINQNSSGISGGTTVKYYPIAKWRNNYSRCTICSRPNYGSTGLTKCRQCRNVYRAVSQSDIAYINRNGGIHTRCSRCFEENRNPDLSGENVCPVCGKKYYVID